LAETTKFLSLATAEDGSIYYSGAVNLLEYKEFWDIDIAKSALMLLDHVELLDKIFQNSPYEGDVRTVIEEELGIRNLGKAAVVFAPYQVGKKNGQIAVFGPSRMNYSAVIPVIRYTRNLIEELGESW
jgi:heat-inducible transcriptional repressor